jgi:hypothetical protein
MSKLHDAAIDHAYQTGILAPLLLTRKKNNFPSTPYEKEGYL